MTNPLTVGDTDAGSVNEVDRPSEAYASDKGDNFFFTLDNSRHDVLNLKFPYPFYYWPDSIAQKAAEILMTFLGNKAENFGWEFGLNPNETYPRGRMFGVLVVENQAGKLGFLAAYSGNISIPDKGNCP